MHALIHACSCVLFAALCLLYQDMQVGPSHHVSLQGFPEIVELTVKSTAAIFKARMTRVAV